MLINELIVPAPAWGAALPGARLPLLTVAPSAFGHGETYAPTSSLGFAAGAADVAGVLGVCDVLGASGAVAAEVRPPAAANGLPTNNLKQFVQMKTRVNVDGDGARGPEPEREQA